MINWLRRRFESEVGNEAEGGSRVNLFHLEHAEKPGATFHPREEGPLRERGEEERLGVGAHKLEAGGDGGGGRDRVRKTRQVMK